MSLSIYPLFFQEAGRRAFWSVNGPRIVQVGYEDEEDPKVMEAYEQLGSLVQNTKPSILLFVLLPFNFVLMLFLSKCFTSWLIAAGQRNLPLRHPSSDTSVYRIHSSPGAPAPGDDPVIPL